MAKVFKTNRDKLVEIQIDDLVFKVDPQAPGFASKMKSFGLKMVEFSKREDLEDISNMSDNELLKLDITKYEETNREIAKLFVEGIDSLLGKGSIHKIYGEEEINLREVSELAHFVISEIQNYVDNEVLSKYSPDRLKK